MDLGTPLIGRGYPTDFVGWAWAVLGQNSRYEIALRGKSYQFCDVLSVAVHSTMKSRRDPNEYIGEDDTAFITQTSAIRRGGWKRRYCIEGV